MSTPEPTTPEKPGLLSKIASLGSIERAVAFIVGPIVIAGSATLSGWLSTKLGVEVSSGTITAAVGSGGLAAGALVYKWLDGRQFPALLKDEKLAKAGFSKLIPFADDIKLIPGAEGDIQAMINKGSTELANLGSFVEGTALGKMPGIDEVVARLEYTIKDEVSKAVDALSKQPTGTAVSVETKGTPDNAVVWTQSGLAQDAGAPVQSAPPPTPIPAATTDPAPATPLQVPPEQPQAPAANAGVASPQ